MIEDYAVHLRIGRSIGSGCYEITRMGTRREIMKYQETLQTEQGEILPEVWREKVLEEITIQGELDLLEKIKEHCRTHCAWLYKEKDIEEYAMECHCSRSYLYWEDFNDDSTVIWM